MNKLPHRFSEAAFRKYEKVIAQIAMTYPRPVRVSPEQFGLSPETIRGRLRDACSSLATHQWPTQLVKMANFNSIDQSQLTISIQPDGTVVAGNKQMIKEDAVDVIDAIQEDEILDCCPSVFEEVSPLHQDVRLMMWQASNGALKKKLKLKLTEYEFDYCNAHFDVAIISTNIPNTYILS